jgi:hypothetical protein
VEDPSGQDLIVYHAWDVEQTARRMCIDPLIWTPDGPVVDARRGPTSTSVAARGAPREAPAADVTGVTR